MFAIWNKEKLLIIINRQIIKDSLIRSNQISKY